MLTQGGPSSVTRIPRNERSPPVICYSRSGGNAAIVFSVGFYQVLYCGEEMPDTFELACSLLQSDEAADLEYPYASAVSVRPEVTGTTRCEQHQSAAPSSSRKG
jgi:hypothetical protein